MDRAAGLIVRLVVTLGIAATSMGAQDPDAILRRSAEAYRKLHSLEVSGLLAAPVTRDGVDYEVRWPVSMAQADSTLLPADSPVPVLSPLLRFGQAEFRDGSGSAAPLDPPELSSPKGWSLFDQIDQNVRQVRLLPNETVELDSHSVSCWVVEVDYTPGFPGRALSGSAIRYRIDPSSLLVLGVSFSSRDAGGRKMIPWTFTARSVETNQRPPEWALRTLPQLAGEEREEWRARRAPEFTLRDLDGREVSLASLRGKAVLLSFWASWCAPCKEELPLIEKLKAEWEPEGLEVWAITNESAAKARAWLDRHGIGLRTLVDEDRNAFRAYDAEQIPVSVVLDRDGAVVSYIVGLGGETYFRTAIEKALAGGVAEIQ